MKQKTIVGTAMGLAAIAMLIDHTRHRLPEPQTVEQLPVEEIILCGLEANPCSLQINPCGLNPCGLTPDTSVSPCSL